MQDQEYILKAHVIGVLVYIFASSSLLVKALMLTAVVVCVSCFVHSWNGIPLRGKSLEICEIVLFLGRWQSAVSEWPCCGECGSLW